MRHDSTCIGHEPCPDCGSRNNLARYDDGHAWCFGCGRREPPKHRPVPQAPKAFTPPTDLVQKLPFLYQKWLDQYELRETELAQFQWSKHQNRMIFLVKIRDKIVFWEGRSLTETPKSLSFGKKPYVIFYQGMMLDHLQGESIVIVEDVVSAMKVGRYVPSLPLFGSNLSKDHALKLARSFKNIYVWLDSDKYGKSIETTRELSILGVTSIAIRTNEDPKFYSNPDKILAARGVLETT